MDSWKMGSMMESNIDVNRLNTLLGSEEITAVWIDGVRHKVGYAHSMSIEYRKRDDGN